jgi:hypothetical protein
MYAPNLSAGKMLTLWFLPPRVFEEFILRGALKEHCNWHAK